MQRISKRPANLEFELRTELEHETERKLKRTQLRIGPRDQFHDSLQRIVSLIYYAGGIREIRIGP